MQNSFVRTLYQFRLRRNDEETAVPFPYPKIIDYAREEETAVPFIYRPINCRDTALPSPDFGNINSDATGFDINSGCAGMIYRKRQCRFPTAINCKDTALPFPPFRSFR